VKSSPRLNFFYTTINEPLRLSITPIDSIPPLVDSYLLSNFECLIFQTDQDRVNSREVKGVLSLSPKQDHYECEFGTFNQANSRLVLKSVSLKMRDRNSQLMFAVDNAITIISIKEGDIRNHFRVRNQIV
jgi:hypothetical protein